MDFSRSFSYSTPTPPKVSGSGRYVAWITESSLVVRNTQTLASRSIISLPNLSLGSIRLAWDCCILRYTSIEGEIEDRLAVVSDDTILVYCFSKGNDDAKVAEIAMAPGALYQVSRVDWISSRFRSPVVTGNGSEENQVVRLCVFQRNGLKALIVSDSGVEHEIIAPKNTKIDYKDLSSFSILSRPETKDVVNIVSLSDSGHAKCNRFPLHEMLDATVTKWSPSGLFLAAADSSVVGTRIGLWALDGTFINQYTRQGDDNDMHFGVCKLEWVSTSGDEEMLILGDYDGHITILSTLSFQPVIVLSLGSIYTDVSVWKQSNGGTYQSHYQGVRLPYRPVRLSGKSPMITKLEVSPDGQYLAVTSEDMPQVLWIWALNDLNTVTLVSALDHLSPISSLSWSRSGILLILPQNSKSFGTWDSTDPTPQMHDIEVSADLQGVSWIEEFGENSVPRVLTWTRQELKIGSYLFETGSQPAGGIYDNQTEHRFKASRFPVMTR